MSYLFALLSGILTALPFLFPKLYLLSWISMVPLFVIAVRKKSAYRHGLVFGMGFYILLYYWFVKLYPMDFMGLNESQSVLVIATCWIGLSLLQALEMAFVPFVFRRLRIEKAPWTIPFSAAACWCAFEWLQTLGWTGVPWGRLAVSQYGALPMIQSASLLGSYFVGFLIVLTNGFLALFYLKNEPVFRFRKKKQPDPDAHEMDEKSANRTASVCGNVMPHGIDADVCEGDGAGSRTYGNETAGKSADIFPDKIAGNTTGRNVRKNIGHTGVRYLPLAAAFLVLLSNGVYGLLCLSHVPSSEEKEPIKVALIQGNLASGDKWADDSAEHSVELYSALTREACAQGDIGMVLWPETVLTFPVRNNSYYDGLLRELASETGAVLLVGALDTVFNSKTGQTDVYNAMLAYAPDGTRSDSVYYKRHLVPFGEYVPMAELIRTVLPQLSDMNLLNDDLTHGTEPTLIPTQWGNVGSLICFDSIYETLTLDSVRNGAGLIALITNDSWYLDSAAVYQHNGHAVLRAVENGRYVARAANTGISSIITPKGEITELLEPLKEGYVIGDVRFSDETTPYVRVGNIIVLCSFIYIGTIVLWKLTAAIRSAPAVRRHTRKLS